MAQFNSSTVEALREQAAAFFASSGAVGITYEAEHEGRPVFVGFVRGNDGRAYGADFGRDLAAVEASVTLYAEAFINSRAS